MCIIQYSFFFHQHPLYHDPPPPPPRPPPEKPPPSRPEPKERDAFGLVITLTEDAKSSIDTISVPHSSRFMGSGRSGGGFSGGGRGGGGGGTW